MANISQQITKKRLTNIRKALLQLHQNLLDYQKLSYEKKYGRVQSTGKMFNLASSNKDFAWLRSLSELIVGLDGYIDAAEYDERNVKSLIAYTKKLLNPKAKGGRFERLYFDAIQNDPAVLISHRNAIAALAQPKKPRKKKDQSRQK